MLDPHPAPSTYISKPVLIWNAAVALEPPAFAVALAFDAHITLNLVVGAVGAAPPEGGAPNATIRCSLFISAASIPLEVAAFAIVT